MKETLSDFPGELKKSLMTRLYNDWFTYSYHEQIGWFGNKTSLVELPGTLDFSEWSREQNISLSDATIFLGLCHEQGWIEYIESTYVQMSGQGILYWEESGDVEKSRAVRSREVAFAFLRAADMLSAEERRARLQGGFHAGSVDGIKEMLAAYNISPHERLAALRLIQSLGWVEKPQPLKGRSISETGKTELIAYEQLQARVASFQELVSGKKFTPQQRGHELEQLLGKVLRQEGWNVESNVRTIGQEHDLIINRQLEYYLVQCKWEKKKMEDYAIGSLRDRVSVAMGMRGIFVSMFGYTSAAIQANTIKLSGAPVLLFGPKDITDLIQGHQTFSSLLSEKFHIASTKRKMLIDGEIN